MITYLGEQIIITPLATPDPPTLVVHGGSDGVTYSYQCVGIRSGSHTEHSSSGTTNLGPTTLGGIHYIDTKPPVLQGVSAWDIYRVTGGATQGKIGRLTPVVVNGIQTAVFRDNGRIADDTSPPTENTTGSFAVGGHVDFSGLPTEDPLVVGRLWNDGGTVKVSAGD